MAAVPIRSSFIRRHPLIVFFALAYLISWGLSFFAVRGLLPFEMPAALATLAGFLYHFGPAAAAIIVAAGVAGRTGLRELLGSLLQWRVAWYWYALVAAYPVALQLVSIWIGARFGVEPPSFFNPAAAGLPDGNPLVMGVMVFFSTLVLTGLAGEIGWRGFALPVLQRNYTPLAASLVIALLWAPWHYNPLGVSGIRPFVPWHVVSVFEMSILLTFLYNSTGGNLLMVVLFRSFAIFSDWLAPTNPLTGGDVLTMSIQTLLNLAVAVIVVVVFGAGRLSVRGVKPHTWRNGLL